MTREARLLFLCAGPSGNDAEIGRLAGLPLNWALVARLAMTARAVPVVVRRIRRAVGAVPDVAAALGRLAMVEEFELQRMEERLDETIAAFEGACIPTVLLKGSALARSVFESVVDRPMLDLDVLVRPEDTDAARAAAAKAGWVWKHDVRYAPFFSTHHHLPPLRDGRGTRALLELHTGLFPAGNPFQLETSRVFDRACLPRRPSEMVRIPSPEDHAVYLAAHWVWSHMMNGGAWRALRDIGALTVHTRFDWEACVARAKDARAASCVYWTLRLARTMANIEVPEFALRSLMPPTPRVLLNRLERYFVWQVSGGRSCPSVRLGALLWSSALRPGWSGHGPARPWKNPELAIWVDGPKSRPSRTQRLVESLSVARTFVGL
jgi:hypothetical protein